MPAENRTLAGASARQASNKSGVLSRGNSVSTKIAGSTGKLPEDRFEEQSAAQRNLVKLRQELEQIEHQFAGVSAKRKAIKAKMEKLEEDTDRAELKYVYDQGDGRRVSTLDDLKIELDSWDREWDFLAGQRHDLDIRIKALEAVILTGKKGSHETKRPDTHARQSSSHVSSSQQAGESQLEKTRVVKRPTPDHDQVRINYPLPPEILAGRKK
jgi:predicted  nucleic acid-binding Zn-ribbon protein